MISAIVPVRDGGPWLAAQLAALAAQDCPEPWEVVIADNGSRDGSAELARRWAEEHPEFRVVDASARPGPSAARNMGAAAASGELLAFCDADDVVQPGWLAGCAAALADADVVAGHLDLWSLNGGLPAPTQAAATRQLGFLPAALGANLAVRRAAFEAVGGFDEELATGEDIDLSWRLQLAGFRFTSAPAAVVAKRERTQFGQVFRQARTYGRCGPVLFRRYRSAGARRDLAGALRAWAWLVVALPTLVRPGRRTAWARTAAVRIGRLESSVTERVFFP
jgi:GT2 family glycosyltransferase